MSKLTIGICVYDDYDGAFFTLQSLRMYHYEVMDRVEFVVINNNPASEHGKALKNIVDTITEPKTYLEYTKYSSPFIKGKIFDIAETEYVLVMDSHVLLEPGSLKKLLDYYDKGLITVIYYKDLYYTMIYTMFLLISTFLLRSGVVICGERGLQIREVLNLMVSHSQYLVMVWVYLAAERTPG